MGSCRKELISVIVPVHNGQDYLEKCIDSIAAQTYEPLEIIVVNDGSTDATAQACQRLRHRYSHLRVITLPDVGVAAARNRGIEQAQGDYLTFVDADDRLRPDMLSRLYDSLQSTESDMAGCRFAAWSTQTQWERLADGGRDAEAVPAQVCDSCHYLRDHILRDNCRCWSKLYRRSLIGEVRFREELTIGEDLLFLVDLLPRLQRAAELEYQGYGYYQNPGGLMKRPFKPAYMDQIKCWELAGEEILRADATLEAQINGKLMTAIMLTVGKIALLPGRERREAREYLAICKGKISRCSGQKESCACLPKGYRLKVRLFAKSPALYTASYHFLQRIKR